MTNQKDPNKKHYFDLVSKEEQVSSFTSISESEVEVTVWCKGEPEEKAENFEVMTYTPENGIFVLESKGGFLAKLAGSPHANKEILVKIPCGKVHYFTNTFLHLDKITKQYTFKVENDVYISRQRTNYRLMANQYNTIQFKIDEEVFDALDISAGGTSFIISSSHQERFAKGKVFSDCVLRFNRMNFDIKNARIAGAWEQKTAGGDVLPEIKLGVAFEDIPPDVEEALFKHINGEARMEEVRKKIAAKSS